MYFCGVKLNFAQFFYHFFVERNFIFNFFGPGPWITVKTMATFKLSEVVLAVDPAESGPRFASWSWGRGGGPAPPRRSTRC